MSHSDAIPLPAVLARRLPALGIDLASLLREAGLPPGLLTGAKARVSTAGFFSLWRALERQNRDPAFGLRLAHAASLDQLDVASIAAMHAPTFGEALVKLARYKRLVCPEDVQIEGSGGEAGVAFRWWLSDAPPPARLIDACFASVLLLARGGSGRHVLPLRVEFARQEMNREVFEAHFGCAVAFNTPVNRIVFAAESLELPFCTANPDLLAMLLPGLEAALAQDPASDPANDLANELGDANAPSFADQVKSVIRRQMQGQRPTVQAVASALALSPRTLQRRLSESGTSYQRMLDEVREQMACELLGKTELDSGEIAFLLGFEELNSFNRAFSAWQGTSPLRWRQQSHTRKHLHPCQ